MKRTRNEDIDKKIGENLKYLRKIKGITQGELGEELGVTFQTVQKYEKAVIRVTCSTAYELCRILGCKITDLIPSGNRSLKELHKASMVADVVRNHKDVFIELLEEVE